MNQDTGDLMPFGNEPQGRLSVKRALIPSVDLRGLQAPTTLGRFYTILPADQRIKFEFKYLYIVAEYLKHRAPELEKGSRGTETPRQEGWIIQLA